MSYSQYPQANPQVQVAQPTPPPKKDNRNLIYALLTGLLLVTWGYIIWDKNNQHTEVAQLKSINNNIDSARNAIQIEFNNASAKLDSLTGANVQMQGALAQRNADIQKQRNEINSILKKKNATAEELSKAKLMIAELNGKIEGLYAEIEKLKGENKLLTDSNQQLAAQRNQLTTEKGQLENNLTKTQEEKAKVEDVASTLHASNIAIEGIHAKGSGKETETDKANRVSALRITFNIDENRVATSGKKDVYVAVYSPDGNLMDNAGTFQSRDEGDKAYTNKIAVDYEQGKRSAVSYDFAKGQGNYQSGNYKIEIYNNGYKIGEGTKTLKKGGLF